MNKIYLLIISFAFILIPKLQGQTTFSSDIFIDTLSVINMVSFDVDNDGDADIVYNSLNPSSLYWYENDGYGNFFELHTIDNSIDSIYTIYSADIDNDNDIDIIGSSKADSCLFWFENINQGDTFIKHIINNDVDSIRAIFSVDINNNNYPDILYSNLNTLTLILNNQNNNFYSPIIISDTTYVSHIFADDLDDDGDIDIICNDYVDSTIVWYKNDGSINFTLNTIATSIPHTSSISTADFDNDGKRDILATSEYTPQKIIWFKNNFAGNFSTENIIASVNYNIVSSATADFDNDGDIDVVVGGFNYIYFYENDGSGTFSSHQILSGCSYANRVISADIDNDGDKDIFSIINWNKKVAWLKNLKIDEVCQVANYQLNGNALDISGNNYNGTFVGSSQLTEDRNYNANSAYAFDTSSYMIYTQAYDLGLNQNLSYSAWLKIDTLINDTSIFTFVFDTINQGTTIFGIGVLKATNELIIAHDTATNSPEIINTGFYVYPHTNYHIAVIRDDANKIYSLYVNNNKIDDYTYTTSPMAITPMLQGITINAGEPAMAINAIIDDVVLYNCLIDSATVDSLYHIGAYTNNDNCQVVNWQLDGDSIDISGNNYDGMFLETTPTFTEDRFGNPNSAYIVDTANAVFYGGNYSLGLQNSISYSCWLNIDTLINDTCFVSLVTDENMTNISFGLIVMNDTLVFMHYAIDTIIEIHTNYVIEKNQFNHIVINRDNDLKEYSLYINNQLENIYPYSDNPIDTNSSQGIILGFPDSEIGFNGIIDDVIFYNCLIDSATIDSLYNIGNWQCNDFMIDSVDVLDAVCGQLNGSGEVFVSGGSGEYSYLWSNGDTLSYTDSLEAGTNSILVTDSIYGCTQSYYFSIQNIGAPTININNTNIQCYGDNVASINSTVIGGTLPYIYNWSTGEHTESISNLYAGTYELTVIDDAGCIATQQIEITQPDELELSFTTTNSACNTSDGTATVNITGGISPYTVSWNTGSSSNPLTGVLAGAYDLTVTDDNSCSVIGSAMISDNGAPTITIDSIVPGACNTNGAIYVSISDTVNSPNYEWDGMIATSEDLLTAIPNFTHVLTVHDGNCTAMQDIYVDYILPEPQEICMVTVDSLTGANLVVWEKPVSTIIDGYMIYRETSIPDEYIQIGYTPYDDLGVYVDSMAYPWIRSYKYKIATKDMCDMISEMSPAHKTIHVNLNLGYLSNTINLIWDDYEGFPYSSFNILRFDVGTGWNNVAGSPLPGTLHSITADVLMTTSMFAITVDKPGTACLATKTSGGPYNQSVSNIDDYGIETIIESVKKQATFNIFPNPTDNIVNIESSKKIIKIKISDISGQIIFEKEINSKSYIIDVSSYSKGVYVINLYSNDNISVKKLIVE